MASSLNNDPWSTSASSASASASLTKTEKPVEARLKQKSQTKNPMSPRTITANEASTKIRSVEWSGFCLEGEVEKVSVDVVTLVDIVVKVELGEKVWQSGEVSYPTSQWQRSGPMQVPWREQLFRE